MEELNQEEQEAYWAALLSGDYDPDWIVPLLEKRENQELDWCLIYPGHGTDGHHKFIVIQKLYDMLDTAWRVMNSEQRNQVKEVALVRRQNNDGS